MTAKDMLRGRPVSLHVLDYGLFRVHSGPRDVGIVGFLIRTDAGEEVLVDTGFPRKYACDAAAASLQDGLEAFGTVLTCTPANMPDCQLALAGSAPDRITLMIQTHGHIDHVGHIDACPQAPILIAAAERAEPRPLYFGDARPVEWPDRDYLLVDADVQIGPGFQILFAPGHSPGQIALMIELPETGPVLITSDAISRPAEIDEGFAGSWDVPLAILNGKRLMDLAVGAAATVIFGHCPDQWPHLRKAPDCYR